MKEKLLTDTHCHLDDRQYESDLEEVLGRAESMGFILNPGCDIETSTRAIEIAESHPNVYAAVGMHPIDLGDYNRDEILPKLKELAQHEKVVAIGEIGLDYHYPDNPSKEVQHQAFADQIDLAGELGLPFIVHDREAHGDVLEIIKEHKKSPGVVHAYSGSVEMAKILIDLGLYISIGGTLTFKNARKAPDVIREIPLDRIMLETDGPYMAPVPHRGKRNEPVYTELVAEKIAEIKGIPVEEVLEQTAENARRFFGVDF